MPIVLLSLAAVALVGLGTWFFPERTLRGRLPEPFVAGVLGLGLSHALFYTGLSARAATFGALAVGLVAAGAAALLAWRIGWRPSPSPRAVGLVGIGLLPATGIVLEPLIAWDARHIWFFHGKIAWSGPAGLLTGAWAKPEIYFSHTDYPKLIALLGAQTASLTGYWNDHWPKAGLLLLLALLLAGLAALPARTAAIWIAAAFLAIDNWHHLWAGWADGWVASFAFLSAAGLGIFLLQAGERPLWIGAGSLSLLAQLKVEGAVLAAILAGAFLVAIAWRRQGGALRAAWDWRMALLAVAPALWFWLRHRYGLTNEISGQASLGRMWGRAFDPEFWRAMGSHYLVESSLATVLPAFAVLEAWRRWRAGRGGNAGWRLALWVIAGYTAFLVVAFLGTHWDVESHLASSMRRLAHTVAALLAAATFLAWWSPSPRPGETPQADRGPADMARAAGV